MSEYCVAGTGTRGGVRADETSNQIRGRLGAIEGMEMGRSLMIGSGRVRNKNSSI